MTVPATIKELKKYDEATDKLKSLLEKKESTADRRADECSHEEQSLL